MKKYLSKIILLFCMIVLIISFNSKAQTTTEWRLVNPTFNSTDPDAGGPAAGSATFTLQIHTTSGTINNINVIATGWSYQSTKLMVPTSPACVTLSNPANVVVAAPFVAGGFTYTTVNQCNIFPQNTGGQLFDRTVAGTLDGTGINLTTTWVDVFTVTVWTLGATFPEGGYVMINSSSTGSPGPLPSYSVSDDLAIEYPANSLTYTTTLALGSILPVQFTKFVVNCSDKGAVLNWATGSEINSDYFAIERSTNGIDWTLVGTEKAAGTSSTTKSYQQIDISGGASYYRIKQVDLDGKFIYTNIIRSNCGRKNMDIVIYPVPARDVLNVVIQSDRPLATQLIIYDGTGKLVRRMNASLVSGSNTFNFYLNGLPSGEYMIRSSDPAINLKKKFTILQ